MRTRDKAAADGFARLFPWMGPSVEPRIRTEIVES